MKRSLILLLAAALQAGTFAYGQHVTLRKKNIPLRTVLRDLQKQSGYHIFYDSEIVPASSLINVNIDNLPVEKALDTLLDPYQLEYAVVDKNIILNKKTSGPAGRHPQPKAVQERVISGQVVSKDGEPIPAVTVTEKGTTNSGMTDSEGSYSLRLSTSEPVLVFTSLGFETQEKQVGVQNEINLILQEAIIEMDEVVIVGYGEQKKVNLTGAVSQLSGKEFEDRPLTQLSQALQGQVPNLNVVVGSGKPGTSGSVNVRGNTSINGGGPLILIDGVLGTLDRINVNDVESVTVLKDASAAAVYGARGAFGVILVTTKKGSEDGKNTIDITSTFGFTTHAVNTDFITSGYLNAKINDEAMYNTLGYRTTRYTDEDYQELQARINDKEENPERPWVVVKKNASGQDMYRYYGNFDWYNYLYDDVRPKSDHNISFKGKSGKTSYSLSGALSSEQGIFNIQPDEYDRHNLRANITSDITDWLTIRNNTHFFKSSYDWSGFADSFNKRYNGTSNSATYHYHPMYVPRNPDGTLTGYSGINSYPIGSGLHNALESGTMKGYSRGTEFTNTAEAIIKLNDDLTVTGNYTYREYRSEYSYRNTKQYYSNRPGIMELSSQGRLNQDQLNESMSKYHWNFINIFANYQKSFGKHNLTAMLGFNQEDRTHKRVGGVGQDLLSETLNDLDLVIGEKQFSGGADEWAVRGGFFRLNYDFAGKYLFEASGRYDGTSRFPKNSRFGFFPSFSAGWRISEENFFEPVKPVVGNLKLRFSYGSLGNQEVDTYAYIPAMGTGQISYLVNNQRLNVTYNPSPVAKTLTWEEITTSNIGLDLDLLNYRLGFTADYYIRDTKGMLSIGQTLPEVFGAGEPKVNAADLRTTGFDISISWRDNFMLANKPFNYSVRGILSDYTSEITKFSDPAGLINTYYEGQQLGEIWGYTYDGFFKTTEEAQAWAKQVNQDQINKRRVQGPTADLRMLQAGDIKILDLNGDGIINTGANTLDDPGDRRIIGNSQPRYSYGMTFSANWNNFDASIFFQGIGRRHWYPNLESQAFWSVYARPYDSFIPTDFPEKIWSEEHPDSYFPFLRAYTAQNSELSVANNMYMQNLAYLKIRNLTIGYSLPQKWMERIHVAKLRVFVSGENLHTWTKLETDYIDPEQVMTDDTGRSYPMGRTFSFGAQLSF